MFRNIAAQPLKAAYRLIGGKGVTILVGSIPVGVALGVIEIVTASLLYAVLIQFHLVTSAAVSSKTILGISPAVALIIAAIMTALLRFASQIMPTLCDHAMTGRLREAMVNNTLGNITERDMLSVSEITYMLANTVPKSGEFVNGIATLAVTVCLIGLILAGMLRLSWQLTVIALGFATVLALLMVALRRTYSVYIDAIHASLRKFTASIVRDVRNNHLLRVTGVNEQEAERLVRLSRQNIHAMKGYNLVFYLSNSIPSPAAVLLIVGVFWLNARLGLMAPGGLVPLVYLLSRVGGGVAELSAAVSRLQRQWPFFAELIARSRELFPEDIEELRYAKGALPADVLPLEVGDLEFGRGSALTAPVTLTARHGDVVVISGMSGRGKTTLVMTLIGLIKPLKGDIRWGGMPIERIDPRELRSKVGYAGPEPFLIDADIRTNLRFGLEHLQLSDRQFEDALRLVRADFVYELPAGLSHELREGGEGISAGQKQRLALARCVLRQPKVLLLDEATSNIDMDTEAEIMDGLRAAFPEAMIIAVSHRASLQRYATHCIEL